MKLSEIVFLDAIDVEGLHEDAINDSGGAYGLRDIGLLESAIAAPQTSAFGALQHDTLAKMAAALGFALAKNHAFVDGNKRVAMVAVGSFLEINGVSVTLPVIPWADHFEALADGRLSREDLAGMLASAMGGDVDVEVDD